MTQSVAITGFGVLTAFGTGAGALREGVFAGRQIFSPVTRFDTAGYRAKHAATDPRPPAGQYQALVRCARAALAMAGTDARGAPTLIGTGGDFTGLPDRNGPPGRPDRLLDTLPALLPERLAHELGLGTPRLAFVNACTASTSALAHGAAMIEQGLTDIAVCGGAHLVSEDGFAKFDSGRALSPTGVQRPFSAGRDGLLHGDGAAVLVLESERRVAARRGPVQAWLRGWGMAGDAHHVIRPHPEGRGLEAAFRAALRKAGLHPHDIGYVNAHGTGTQLNDAAEAAALLRLFGPAGTRTPVSSTKSTTGHMLEATGAVEAVITVLALQDQLIPPTAGHLAADPECPVDCVPNTARPAPLRHAVSLNAAFGGANAALLLESS
ncbi:beta-ketoacyl-[acyl-carrier-protein] synthase family protein [Streptomyces actinomycinicus]|uniref:Beta-ketoacyl-[acyl-carrier-protein] synthase family protein n=1 Tax=Streptomyces actinomycinicus TaxID=1695166 RepID=A0A937ER12_9ACTN|nr:beta-ketoacyl-[acyl-carrier-protein] synthase family protein [Streptomyces actinomycinicus]MBL1086540.1 beta-ketoacyl-[acyl-carrier-protein] synthase family protein [Streptomyces actinomycinicus]